ncbi:MAG: hypothetical protein LBD29_10870 [Treponema sp.]|jgi:chromosome segregation ATPase|nr:hypothetical protein [Treponema sp.]
MDERKKTIKELEGKKKEAQGAVNLILEQLGETLLVRMKEQARVFVPELTEYRRLLQDIDESQQYITTIENDILRLKELQHSIAVKERECSVQTRQLSDCHVRLGELLLETSEFDHCYSSYKQQIEMLIPKIRSLEERLEQLNDKNEANVFSWIGKNAQGMVIRSLLGNSQESLRRIYETLGEHCILSKEDVHGGTYTLLQTIQGLRTRTSEVAAEIARLKTDYRKIGDVFGSDGNPMKRIQDMEKHITCIQGELTILYLRIGTQAADPESTAQFALFLHNEDKPLFDEIQTIRQTQSNIEEQIEKIKASITIDDELAEIANLQKNINRHRRRIAASEQAIAELEEQVNNANQRIETLRILL